MQAGLKPCFPYSIQKTGRSVKNNPFLVRQKGLEPPTY